MLRRAFSLIPRDCVNLRKDLKEILSLGLAVHPLGNVAAPVLHPELQVGVEWRFELFRADNAEAIVGAARSVVS